MPERHAKPQAIRAGAGFCANRRRRRVDGMQILGPAAAAQLTEAKI
jgi:hypothetical protein